MGLYDQCFLSKLSICFRCLDINYSFLSILVQGLGFKVESV